MVAIIDYDAGNIKSVEKAIYFLGEDAIITRDREKLRKADKVILPGVGAFGDAMNKINKYGLKEIIWEIVNQGTPFLGICLGMQLLFEKSEESKDVEGLSLLKGEIIKLPDKGELKIPHIGWNSLKFPNKGCLYKGIMEEAYVYFVHSYYLNAAEPEIVTATSEYGTLIHASVEKGNLFGCQFHPEKSSETGLTILRNFLTIDGGKR